MSIRPILTLGDPRLRLRGEPVTSFGRPLHTLLDDLVATMRDAPGVGLAAPQVGEPIAACVIEVGDRLLELVNPRIVKAAGDDRDLEGCLSIPGYYAYVTRREQVWVVAQDRKGRRIKAAGTGLMARAMQHELDHLDGKLYIDYLESMEDLIIVRPAEDEEADEAEPEPESDRRGKRARTPALA
ncbi:MAG TPA: peptide deformylase [Candidatus Limnocylindrales bacterium]|nr:peptide deformylase [Candidatus Limnocylindrales bacterium]